MPRWWSLGRRRQAAVSELEVATARAQAGDRERGARALVVTRWEDGTEVIFGLGSTVVCIDAVEEFDEVPFSACSSIGEYDEKFFDACEEQAVQVTFSPDPPPVAIDILPDFPTPRSPTPTPTPAPHASAPAAPQAHGHEETFIQVFKEELVKVLDGRTHEVLPHAALPSSAPPGTGATAGAAPPAPGWSWPLLLRVVFLLLAICVAWTTFLVLGIWNSYISL